MTVTELLGRLPGEAGQGSGSTIQEDEIVAQTLILAKLTGKIYTLIIPQLYIAET